MIVIKSKVSGSLKKASFYQRVVALLIDMFIVGIIFSIVTMNFNTSYVEKLNNESLEIMNQYTSGEIGTRDYISKYANNIYEVNRANIYSNIVYVVVCLGYFVIFQYLNGGASIGKRIMGIKIVGSNGGCAKLWQVLVRSCVINEILPIFLGIILIMFSKDMTFLILYSIISWGENLFIIISALMIMYGKKQLGLHDIMSNSMVIVDKYSV